MKRPLVQPVNTDHSTAPPNPEPIRLDQVRLVTSAPEPIILHQVRLVISAPEPIILHQVRLVTSAPEPIRLRQVFSPLLTMFCY